MANKEVQEHVRTLANTLVALLKDNLLKEPKLAAVAMAQVQVILREIESFGFLVTWRAQFNPLKDKKPRVDVTIWEPKPNMTPEQQRLYDEWFFRVSGIKND